MGGNCRGAAKVVRLHRWLDERVRRAPQRHAVGVRRLAPATSRCSPTPITPCGWARPEAMSRPAQVGALVAHRRRRAGEYPAHVWLAGERDDRRRCRRRRARRQNGRSHHRRSDRAHGTAAAVDEERPRVRRSGCRRRARRLARVGGDAARLRRLLPGVQRHLPVERRPRRRGRPPSPDEAAAPDRRRSARNRDCPGRRDVAPRRGVRRRRGTGRWQTVAVVVTYVVATMAYSVWLKHVAVVDLVVVASGFVLRAAAGAVAVDVPMSKWFVLCTVFGSLFIVTGKRYAELREIGDGAGEVRPTLETYTPTYLRGVLTMSCGAAIISYCLWALETKELAGHRPAVLRAVDRADADGDAALPPAHRGGSWRCSRRGVRQRPCPPAARAGLDRHVRARRLPRMSVPRPRSSGDDGVDSTTDVRPAGVEGWLTENRPTSSLPRRLPALAAGPSSRSAASAGCRRSSSPRLRRRARQIVAIDPHAGNDRGPGQIDGLSPQQPPLTGSPSSATCPPPESAIGSASCRPGRPMPTVRSAARSTCCTSTAPTATDRPGPTSVTGEHACRRRRHAADPRCLLVGGRDRGDPARVGVRAAVPLRRAVPVARSLPGRSWTRPVGEHESATPPSSSPSSAGSPATSPSRWC